MPNKLNNNKILYWFYTKIYIHKPTKPLRQFDGGNWCAACKFKSKAMNNMTT